MRDFVADISTEIKPGDIWWLLPTQTAAFINNRDVLLTDPAYDTKANDVAIASVSLVLNRNFINQCTRGENRQTRDA